MFVISGFLLTILFGLLISLLIAPKMHDLERLGLSYVLGLGFQTLFMFIAYLLGLKFTLINTLTILVSLTLILFFVIHRRFVLFCNELKHSLLTTKLTRLEKILVVTIGFFILFSLLQTLYWPVGAWDALVLYDWRAKIFFLTGSMDEGIRRGYFFGVPLLTSLGHTWVYFLGGEHPEFIYTLFLASFALMFYEAIRKYTLRVIALVSVLILITIPEIFMHSTIAYTNLPYTVYFVMGTIYLYLWISKEEGEYLILSALLLGLSAWTRSTEPFWLVNLGILILYSLYRKKIWQPVFFSAVFFSIRQPWIIFENSKIVLNTEITGRISDGIFVVLNELDFNHIVLILRFLYTNVFAPQLVFYLALLVFYIWGNGFHLKTKDYWLAAMIIGYMVLTTVGTYVFSLTFKDWQIGESITRMVMFVPPLIIFYIASSGVLRIFSNG